MSQLNEIHVVTWQLADVRSPNIKHAVHVIAATDIPYKANANRMQNLSIYLPRNKRTETLVGTEATSLPSSNPGSGLPDYQVHIHGGAWRDPQLTSTSIEAAVAHAFSAADFESITAIGDHSDPAREGYHTTNVIDVLHGFALLRSMGLTDGSYILSGHSAGACLASQAVFQPPAHWGVQDVLDIPQPAAFLGLNGLDDLPALVHGLGTSHEGLKDVYEDFLSVTFGKDQTKWVAAGPTYFDSILISKRIQEGKAPRLVVLDQSAEDQLVPMNQMERMKAQLGNGKGDDSGSRT